MTRRAGSALDLELQDAYWELPGGDYVPQGSAPSRLLEDSDHLDASWTATVDSLKGEAQVSPEARQRIKKEVEDFEKQERTDIPAPTHDDLAVISVAQPAGSKIARSLLSLLDVSRLISHRH
ncbi:hypothetical protein SAMN05421812_104478 [Asanoa hainanensis]|uniref:Uncharacterized protein n=1 Tax=Asanoa hainanensis TaxID=560556 RepID=A0A239LNE1_9ACTN|nr:hypothetical protein [Asanoa hainanensis]SNT32197.1 hypothetical protein SAMN05421812_104478 [Asanoa hainanensis]